MGPGVIGERLPRDPLHQVTHKAEGYVVVVPAIARSPDLEVFLCVVKPAAGRNVGDHSFFLDDGVWTDASYDGASTAKIGFASDGYFDVLEKRPDWGAYFALGEQVLFVVQGRAYEIASGDFPPVDVPAQPQTQPPEERSPSVPAPQPETSEESSTPWPRFLVGGAVMAAALLGGGWTWRRRRAAER